MTALTTPSTTPAAIGVLASVGDPARTRTVYSIILLLVALGFAMVLVTAWLVRRTRVDPQVLAPLEKMGERTWRAVPDPQWQRRVLDEVRPAGAEPLQHAPPPPVTDTEFETLAEPKSFDDISGDLARPDDAVAPVELVEPVEAIAQPEPVEPVAEVADPAPEAALDDGGDGGDDDGDDGDDAPESDATRSVASPHGHAGPGRDDHPLP